MVIRNNLRRGLTLPYEVVRGSIEQRQAKAEQFTHRVVTELSGQIKDGGISLSKFGRSLKKSIPDDVKVFVKKNKDDDCFTQLNRIFSKDNYLIAQTLEVETGKGNKVERETVPYIAHEIRHLADSIYHPKILSRTQSIIKKGLDTNKFWNLYNNQVYILESDYGKNIKKIVRTDVRRSTEKALRGYSTNDKIDMLQYMRYSLMTENNAFKEEQKTAKKLHRKKQVVDEFSLNNQSKEYMFDVKIQLFRDMISEIIKKERGINKAKLRKMSKDK